MENVKAITSIRGKEKGEREEEFGGGGGGEEEEWKFLCIFFWHRHENFSRADTIFIPKIVAYVWHGQCEDDLSGSTVYNGIIP